VNAVLDGKLVLVLRHFAVPTTSRRLLVATVDRANARCDDADDDDALSSCRTVVVVVVVEAVEAAVVREINDCTNMMMIGNSFFAWLVMSTMARKSCV